MNNIINSAEQMSDSREQSRLEELQVEIERGNPFAAGELNFRKTLALNGMNYEQIERAIGNFFAAPF